MYCTCKLMEQKDNNRNLIFLVYTIDSIVRYIFEYYPAATYRNSISFGAVVKKLPAAVALHARQAGDGPESRAWAGSLSHGPFSWEHEMGLFCFPVQIHILVYYPTQQVFLYMGCVGVGRRNDDGVFSGASQTHRDRGCDTMQLLVLGFASKFQRQCDRHHAMADAAANQHTPPNKFMHAK